MNENQPQRRTAWALVGGLGVLSIFIALPTIGLIVLLSSGQGDPLTVMLTGLGLLGLALGIGLTWAGLSGYYELPSPKFYSIGGLGILLLLTGGVLGLALLIPPARQFSALFAPLHLAAITFPALFLLLLITWAAGREAALTLRQLMVTLTGGAMTIIIALPVELIGFMVSMFIVTMVTLFIPGGEAELTRLMTLIEGWTEAPSMTMDETLDLLASPIVLPVLGLTLAVVTPLVEELGKTLILGAMGLFERASLTRAYLWGVACGIGFAILEGVTNGVMGLGVTGGWLSGVGSRAMATVMHAITSGLIGLGWGITWRRRRSGRWALPLTYGGAVIIHGLWNFSTLLTIGGAGLGLGSTAASPGMMLSATGILIIGGLLLLGLLTLIGLPLWLRRYEAAHPTLSPVSSDA
jgi:hypothetical protein